MWISVIGMSIAKARIAAKFEKDGFTNLTKIFDQPSDFHSLLNALAMKANETSNAMAMRQDEMIITTGTYWEIAEVFAPTLLHLKHISPMEFELLNKLHRQIAVHLEPPTMFIVTDSSIMNIMNETRMLSLDINEDSVRTTMDLYDAFVDKIRPPTIKADANKSIQEMLVEIAYDIDQLKAAKITDQTLWTRTMYRTGKL